jgi:hypothetical protein
MPTITQPDDMADDALGPQDVSDAAMLAIVRALTNGKPAPDGRPGHIAYGNAQAVAFFLENAPDGALADEPVKPAVPRQNLSGAPLKGHSPVPPPKISAAPLKGHTDPEPMETYQARRRA